MKEVRAFVAIAMNDAMRIALDSIKESVRQSIDLPFRWVNTEQSHLTLKFLGEMPVGLVNPVEGALQVAGRRSSPFTICTGEIGGFPNLRNPRVLWVGLKGDLDALFDVQQSIEELLAPLGFPTADRPYKPHLTLARIRDRIPMDQTRWPVAEIQIRRAEQEVQEIVLMKSELRPEGVRYSRLGVVNLERGL